MLRSYRACNSFLSEMLRSYIAIDVHHLNQVGW